MPPEIPRRRRKAGRGEKVVSGDKHKEKGSMRMERAQAVGLQHHQDLPLKVSRASVRSPNAPANSRMRTRKGSRGKEEVSKGKHEDEEEGSGQASGRNRPGGGGYSTAVACLSKAARQPLGHQIPPASPRRRWQKGGRGKEKGSRQARDRSGPRVGGVTAQLRLAFQRQLGSHWVSRSLQQAAGGGERVSGVKRKAGKAGKASKITRRKAVDKHAQGYGYSAATTFH